MWVPKTEIVFVLNYILNECSFSYQIITFKKVCVLEKIVFIEKPTNWP